MIQFVGNYDDLSSDRGYQFRFYCDKCRNGYMSRFVPSKVGLIGSVLRAAGHFFGGVVGRVGYSSYDLQRMIGGPEHDAALRNAMEEGKKYFHQCTRCGKWVCPESCWNAPANMCEDCAPNFREELAAAQAQAKAEAARYQLLEKARSVDYASQVDLSADHYLKAEPPAERPPSTPVCIHCGADLIAGAKFCPQCGKSAASKVASKCTVCHFRLEAAAKFCPQCGNPMEPVF
ncbi:MAG: zinc ribbon domain-containing protein [Bryobacteraceae bacterium]|nr:zinc ribbon domain-containing protein [Bryobacteraceae bacterium]MDW8378714.1 zinc ribbon domain-containing protein [Bryobacterales bacterium]